MINKAAFDEANRKIKMDEYLRKGIGTYGEKTLHAVLKYYFEPAEEKHEVAIGSFVADIVNDAGIIEIQTSSFDRLRKKLDSFLSLTPVTLVYPVADVKWLSWIDEETGEATKERKSPKRGTPYDCFRELYKIKQKLTNPNLNLCIVLMEMKEYRFLNGWSRDRKRGSTRHALIPIDIIDEIHISRLEDYGQLIPTELKDPFTSKDFKKYSRLSLRGSQTALNVLTYIGAVKRVGKSGNAYIYERCF